MWWMAAAAVAGAYMENQANSAAAGAQAKAARAAYQAKLKASNSVLYANTLNRTKEMEEGRQVQSRQLTSFASAGVDITSGSVLDTLKSTEFNMLKNDFLSNMEAKAQADAIMAQANIDMQTSKQISANAQSKNNMNLINGGLQAASYMS